MHDAKEFESKERKDLPKDATAKERLKYIKDLALFGKGMFGEMSYNGIQSMLDKIIEVSNV